METYFKVLSIHVKCWKKKNTQRRTYKEQKKPEICQFCKDSSKQNHVEWKEEDY